MSTDAAFESRTYAKVDARLIPFLFLCYILAYLDRVNIGFAKLQMQGDLALSEAAFATGAGIFFIGYFFFEVPSNVLLKKLGARAWIAMMMVAWGIISDRDDVRQDRMGLLRDPRSSWDSPKPGSSPGSSST